MAVLLAGCSDADSLFREVPGSGERITLSGEIDQLNLTRADENGFADGDIIGVYVVDYNGNVPGQLRTRGNNADNVRHTFDGAEHKWEPAYDMYWKDKHTHIDVYGYYPYGSPENVEAYPYTVQRDQSKETSKGEMGGYEASDFLWGKAADIAPTGSTIRLPMAHRMASARVTLAEGNGFAEGEWTRTEKTVLVTNLCRKAVIDMTDGSVKTAGGIEETATIPYKRDNEWRAIVVPQTVAAGLTMFSITINGIPYTFKKSEDFTYTAGRMSNFTIRVDKKSDSGQYALTLAGESITPWENDLISHDAAAKEYIIIHTEAGRLKSAIQAAGKDYRTLRNLKVTGSLNTGDFNFMNNEMEKLQALNLKEARVSGALGVWKGGYEGDVLQDAIPCNAFLNNQTLMQIVLPDTLTCIGSSAFENCKGLLGSIRIPEGVTRIGASAFFNCDALTGTLYLPKTLKEMGSLAFSRCGFVCELILPSELTYIGSSAFDDNYGLYGNLILPPNLKEIESYSFSNCMNLTGNLEIPKSVSVIGARAFYNTGLNGTLTLHDGITSIEDAAFENTPFKGELILPKSLTKINQSTFLYCNFSGELKLPKELCSIGTQAFAGNIRLTGTVEFPEGLKSIGAGAFASCSGIEKIILPESLENISYNANSMGGAFEGCYGIRSIVCRSEIPPYVQPGAFNGIAKETFTVEVPEFAVQQYRTAVGWNEFKRIAAHHELACYPSMVCALNTEHRQTLTVSAEGEWDVAEKPDWCEVSPARGSGKTEVTLTIKGMAKSTPKRNGKVVFRLKGKEYTHSCTVAQYGYEYSEDEFITLQRATKGNNGGINIVILGDGYDAKDIVQGGYINDMREVMEHFFGIEPYTTYRSYFNVYTAIPLSVEKGVGTDNTVCDNRFGTAYRNGAGLTADYDEIFRYVLNAPTVNKGNLNQTLVIIVPNSTSYDGICQMWTDGSAIAFCPKSENSYPYDSRGVVQHEAGGHGFGKLGDEYICHNAFIDDCNCSCCGHVMDINNRKSLGWYDNISLTGKMHEVPWSHLISDRRYSNVVDIYEGGYMHSRGVFRSELSSCMNNNIPYYNSISRESIVRRIKRYAGESYSFEDFVANDKRDAGMVTRSVNVGNIHSVRGSQMPPKVHRGRPLR